MTTILNLCKKYFPNASQEEIKSFVEEATATGLMLGELSSDYEQSLEKARDCVANALGDAYDCTRVWSAWSYGTMDSDDFVEVRQDSERLSEITLAALEAVNYKGLLEKYEFLKSEVNMSLRIGQIHSVSTLGFGLSVKPEAKEVFGIPRHSAERLKTFLNQ